MTTSLLEPEVLAPAGGAIRSPLLRLADSEGQLPGGLLADLLREQQTMTAVDRFTRVHEDGPPAQARYYRDLVPLDRPGPGQQYAFEVDLDACTGCKACVAACHSMNGLDETEMWRSVGMLHGGTVQAPAQQTVTTSCHHCVDPACLSGCPVQAYEKDPITGIVRHLDDQCIGCQYCTLMCPYDAPKYNARLGIVRKCDMCSGRLAAAEAPACVQGCPNGAIAIRIVTTAAAVVEAEAERFLPGAPTPAHTVPTTVYKSARPAPPALLPADLYSVSREHSHLPLGILLVFTQLAAGTFALALLAQGLLALPVEGSVALSLAGFALALGLAGLGASVFHLGRPLGAWRALLGLRTSWMSREALAFGLFAKAGSLYALSLATSAVPFLLTLPGGALLARARAPLGVATAVIGLGGVFCSAMIYAATRRRQWPLPSVAFKFFGTSALLGAATLLLVAETSALWSAVTAGGLWRPVLTNALLLMLPICAVLKLLFEATQLRHLRGKEHTVEKRVAILMVRDLAGVTQLRFLLTAVGGILLPLIARPWGMLGPGGALAIFLLLVVGELCERYLFFTTAPPSRMPGSLQ
jgi:formate dehydrogenase iron-sulfur subunit